MPLCWRNLTTRRDILYSILISIVIITVLLLWYAQFGSGGDKCSDPDWCEIAMPSVSLLRFTAPHDEALWNKARLYASQGRPVLLEHIITAVRHEGDLLDGSLFFRKYNLIADYFLDNNNDFRLLASNPRLMRRALEQKKRYDWQQHLNNSVLPPLYAGTTGLGVTGRATILKLGYTAFAREGPNNLNSPLFMGDVAGEAVVDIHKFLKMYHKHKHLIAKPFIGLHMAHEHWGLLSTHFPGRTINWGECCGAQLTQSLNELLDHNLTRMLLTNQHSNFSHPKLIKLPLGLPLHLTNYKKVLWDAMLTAVQRRQKKQFAVAYTSTAAKSFQNVLSCIRKAVPVHHLTDDARNSENNSSSVFQHFLELGKARVGIAIPGPSFDSCRLWEMMTMGVMIVSEKGVGLDRMLWKLPALLVDDFSELTPQLLRTAYVEAIYRALSGDLDLRRLTQSVWWAFIYKVAASPTAEDSLRTVLEYFPLEAEDAGFARPAVPFACANSGTCGSGTKRTPRTYC